jgi:hypothetical protein
MTEYQNVTITVGNNTSVIATTKDLTAEQRKMLLELQRIAPGDISISPDGVVSITSKQGLALFNSFCRENNILDSSDALMQIEVPEGTSLPMEGLNSASAFCDSFGIGGMDPSKMSFIELMTLMLMMTYASEEDRRRALAEVKVTQNQIALDVAIDTWETSREAAEKSYSMETFQAWGTIASGIASGAIAVGSTAYSLSAASKQAEVNKNNDKLAKDQLLKDQKQLQAELNLPNTEQPTINAKKTEVQTAITEKEKLIEAKQKEIKSAQQEKIGNGDEAPTRQQAIDAKQKEIDANNEKINANKEKIEKIDTNERAIEANQKEIDAKTQEVRELTDTPENEAKLKDLLQEQLTLMEKKSELLEKRDELRGGGTIAAEKTRLTEEKTQLVGEKTELERAKTDLAKPITDLEKAKTELERELEGFKVQGAKLARLESVNKQIEDKGITSGDALTPGQIKELENKNEQLRIEIKEIETKGGALAGLGQTVSGVIKGGIDLIAAEYKRKAAFLEADVRLLDTFRGAIQSQTQGIDSSINSANQNMQKIASNLKQVLDEAYSTMSGIIRNI